MLLCYSLIQGHIQGGEGAKWAMPTQKYIDNAPQPQNFKKKKRVGKWEKVGINLTYFPNLYIYIYMF